MTSATCPFCARLRKGEYASTPNPDIVTFEPLNPVTPGHRLFVPIFHIAYFQSAPDVLGSTMAEAARWQGAEESNLIVSSGRNATQTVRHMHVHLVPRHHGDGLMLPWSVQ